MRPRFTVLSVLFLLAALFLTALTAAAQGPLEQVTITGPGLSEPLVITDADTLQAFSFDGFKESDRIAPLPDDTGATYTITRYVSADGTLAPYDRLLYLPPGDDQPAHVFYEGLVAPGQTSPLQGQWYNVSAQSAQTLQGLLPEEASTGFGPILPFFTVPLLLPALLALAVLLVLGLIIYLQRRSIP